MALFEKVELETFKYADLVKLAKQNDVYRRYAPKAELIEKLMAKRESVVETLNDISMPSFMESDDTESDEIDQNFENALPLRENNASEGCTLSGNCATEKYSKQSTYSRRAPLIEKGRNLNTISPPSKLESPLAVRNKSGTPQALRRSLAGPAKPAANGRRGKRQTASKAENKTLSTSQSTSRRITRQRTFEVDSPNLIKDEKKQQVEREETLDVDDDEKTGYQMKRGGTYEVIHEKDCSEVKKITLQHSKMKRQGTFEVEVAKSEAGKVSDDSHSHKLRREGTFEVVNTSVCNDALQVTQLKTPSVTCHKANVTSKRLSQIKNSGRMSTQSPRQSKQISISTPCSIKPIEMSVTGQSVPRRFITSRSKPSELTSSGNRTSAAKSKIPSLMNEIQKKKAEVSAKKLADATGEKTSVAKKAPDFNAIHRRLFNKMESLVDSRQKVIDRANSIQKTQSVKRSPPTTKAVRKLISPKIGKSRLASPKPAFQKIASTFASNVVSIQKRPSVGSVIPGVSKLESPRFAFDAKSKVTAVKANNFGFSKVEPSRKDALKASVMGRKPMKKSSPMAKAKQALQSVRLNKRFELQMKHRLAQQAANH